ncbi:unnamed protein product [Camellia sinensis]
MDDRGDKRRGLSRFPSEAKRGGDRRTERGDERLSRFPHLSLQPKSQVACFPTTAAWDERLQDRSSSIIS